MKKNPIFLILSNLSFIIGGLIGIWFMNVGIGLGHQTQVGGDAILGGLIIAAAFILSLVFVIIAKIRKEGNFWGYLLPLLFIFSICGYVFYIFLFIE